MIFALNQETGGLGLNKNFLGQFKKTYVPQQSYESALPIIQEYNRLVAEGADAQAYANQQDTGFRNYFITDLKSGEATLVGYSDSVKKLNADYKAMSFSAKAAALGTQVLNTALSMGATLLLSWGLEQLIGVLDRYVRSDEIAIDKANELADSWSKASDQISNNKKSLDSISDEYSKLSKGVDQYGNNLSLTSDEYARYHDLANQIANISPDLVSSWDKENNAVLKVKGSVEDLNKAFDDTVRKHNELVVSQAKDLFSGLTSSVANNPILPWQSTGSKLKKDYASEIISSIGSGATKSAIEDLIFSKGQQTQVLMDVLKESGITESKLPFGAAQVGWYADALMKNVDALKSYVSSLEITSSVSESGFQDLAKSYLALSKEFDALPDNAKTAINSVVTNFNADFLSQFSGENGEGKFYKWIDDNLVSGFKNVDLSGILNAKSLFDSSKITVDNYKKYSADFANQIKDMAPEVQDALNETFSPNVDALENNVKEKLIDAYDNSVGSLTLDQLKTAADISLDGGALLSWDQLIQKIKEAQTAKAQSVETLGGSITTLQEQYTLLNSALSEQAENGSMSYETYAKLIEANSKFADSMEIVDGKVRLNAESAYELVDANAKLAQSEAEAGAEAAKQQYAEVAEQLANVQDKIEYIADNGDHFGNYDNLVSQRDMLRDQLALLDQQIQSYGLISSEIKNMYSAYAKFQTATKTANHGDMYKTVRDDVYGKVKAGLDSGDVNVDDYTSALDMYLGEGNYDKTTRKGLISAGKKAQKLHDKYFTKNPRKGLKTFEKDLLKNKELKGLVSKDKNGNFTIADGVTADQIAKAMGMGPEMLQSIFDEIEAQDPEAKLNDLYEKLFPEPKVDTTKPETPISKASDQYESDVSDYEKKAAEWSTRIYSANELIQAALEGKAPPTPPSSPTGRGTTGGSTPTAPVSSVENRKNEGLSGGKPEPKVVAPLAQQVIEIVLNVSADELARISGVIKGGVDGEIPITADPTEASAALAALGLEIQNLPGATVNISVVDPNGAVNSVSSLSDAISLINQGAAASVNVTFTPTDASQQVTNIADALKGLPSETNTNVNYSETDGASEKAKALSEYLGEIPEHVGVKVDYSDDNANEKAKTLSDYLNKIGEGANAEITADTGTSQSQIQGVADEIDKVQDKTAIIDADTSYIPGDVSHANSELAKVDDKVAQLTADASSIPDTVSTANDEIAKLQNKTVTITTVYKTEGDSSGGGGGSGGKGTLPSTGSSSGGGGNSGGGGSSSGSGAGRKSGISSSAGASTGYIASSAEEADAKLNPLLALLLSIKSAWDNLWGRGAVPDLVEPTGVANAQAAKDALDGIANETIPEKPLSVNTDSAKQKNNELESDLKKPVTKDVKINWIAGQRPYAKGVKRAKAGPAIVDDGAGAEGIKHADGTFEIGTDEGPRPVVLEEGDTVYTAEETKAMARRKGTILPRFESGWNLGDDPAPNNTHNTSSQKKNTSDKWKKYVDKLFDWIEIRLKRLQSVTDKWKHQIEDAIGYISKNSAIDSSVAAMTDQINALNAAYNHYIEQANTVAKKTKLSQDIIRRVQNGTIDISSYSGDTKKKIQEYMDWWEKAQGVKDQIEGIKDEQNDLIHQKMDNIVKQYENIGKSIDAARNKAKSAIDLKVSSGKEVTAADYQPAINAQMKSIENMRTELAALTAEFNKQIQEGTLVEGSDAWYNYVDQINSLDESITQASTDLNELNDSAEQIVVTNLGYQLTALQTVQSGIQQTLDLIEAQGRTATSDSYLQLIDNGMKQIANLQVQNEELKKQQAGLDKNSEKYQEIQSKIDGNLSSINEIKTSQEKWNDSIADLKIAEVQKYRDELEKTNETYNRQLGLQKAQEDLERAKTQRRVKTYVEGKGYVYQASEKDVQEKTRALEEKQHEETLAKLDDMIEAIEKSKADNNVYDSLGTNPNDAAQSPVLGALTNGSPSDAYSQDTLEPNDVANLSQSLNALASSPLASGAYSRNTLNPNDLIPLKITDLFANTDEQALANMSAAFNSVTSLANLVSQIPTNGKVSTFTPSQPGGGLGPITIQKIEVTESSDANATVKAIADNLSVQLNRAIYR